MLHTVSLKQNMVQPDMVKNNLANLIRNDVADDTLKHTSVSKANAVTHRPSKREKTLGDLSFSLGQYLMSLYTII